MTFNNFFGILSLRVLLVILADNKNMNISTLIFGSRLM